MQKLIEIQALLAPHTKCTLYKNSDSTTPLWSGEIESCDFKKFGDYLVVSAAYSGLLEIEKQGFRIYLLPLRKFGLFYI